KRKALTSALLNEEEKRRERKRGNRHDERHDRPRDAERQRKCSYEAKGIEDMTLEINALQTRLTELCDKRRKTDDGLLWCYMCKKKGDHEAKGHPGYDPNYVNKRAGGGRQSQRGTHGGKSRPRPTSDGSDSDSDAAQYHVNSVTVDDTRRVTENHWTLDNCATGHVTGNHHFMHSWKGTSSLILPNQAVVKGRRGTAKINLLCNGEHATLKLHDVTYEPTIYKNLISHVRLLRSGHQLAHQDLKKTTYVHRFNGHELHFALSDSLYVLQDVVPRAAAERINATTLATDKALDPPSDAKLRHWHNKLNHTDMRQVAKIIQPILLPGIDSSTTNHICDGCAQGQAKRVSLRNTHHYVPTDPLECLNGDLCGPVKPRTVNHESFTSMFIDQASRYIFGKLLNTKDDTILHLDALVSDLNSQIPHTRVRMLHTDGGGEYTSSAFKAACLARGIRQKFTNVETPAENHLAEKANEFVFSKIRTYLTISGLPSTLWGYCFDYVVFVYNNTPQELLNQRTPFEALFSKPSRLYMLKTFGCLAYKFIPKPQRKGKLSNSAVPCVFLGYAHDRLGYKLWNPKDKTVTVSRSVTFDESKVRNADMFANADFAHGRLRVPQSNVIAGITSADDLKSARFQTYNQGSKAL
ncbi:hypothetical protein DYB28_004572, partial [Aphanomyces astaci]